MNTLVYNRIIIMKGYDDMKTIIVAELPKHKVGTKFVYRYGKAKFDATVIGYHIEHNTDTKKSEVTYRAEYKLGDLQIMKVNVARATVDSSVVGVA